MSIRLAPLLPDPYVPDFPWIEMLGMQPLVMSAGAVSGAVNRAIYVPVAFPVDCTLYQIRFWAANATGNYDLGLYNSALLRLASSGSTAMPNTLATLTLPEIRARAGEIFYAALALSNTSGSALRRAFTVTDVPQAVGVAQEASALPLPATATPVTRTDAAQPVFAFGVR